MRNSHLYLLLLTVLLASCSLTQRRYMPGYYVEGSTNKIDRKELPVKQLITSPERISTATIKSIRPEELKPVPNSLQNVMQVVVKHQQHESKVALLPQPRKYPLLQESIFPSDSLSHVEPTKTKRVNAGLTILYGLLSALSLSACFIVLLSMALSDPSEAIYQGQYTAAQYAQLETEETILAVVFAIGSIVFLVLDLIKAHWVKHNEESTKKQKTVALAGKIIGFLFIPLAILLLMLLLALLSL